MSLAPNQAESKGRNLSELYQMIGRGFARMRGVPLPSNWRLDLLASKGTRKLCRLYGNAELLLSQICNESVEGRKMTLGTVLGSIGDADSGLEYRPDPGRAAQGRQGRAFERSLSWQCKTATTGRSAPCATA